LLADIVSWWCGSLLKGMVGAELRGSRENEKDTIFTGGKRQIDFVQSEKRAHHAVGSRIRRFSANQSKELASTAVGKEVFGGLSSQFQL